MERITQQTLDGLSAFRAGPDGYEADTVPSPHGGVLGALTMYQQVMLAERLSPGKHVQSLQVAFPNGGVSGRPVTFSVERLQDGRSFGFLTVTTRQDDLVLARAELTLTADEDDYLRHPAVGGPRPDGPDWAVVPSGLWPGTARRAADSGLGGGRLALELPAASCSATQSRALAALATEPAVMTLFLEYVGVPAGVAVPANVLAQTVTFFEPFDAASGLVLDVVPRYAGRGRVAGDGRIYDPSGRLLAGFSTSGLLRAPRS